MFKRFSGSSQSATPRTRTLPAAVARAIQPAPEPRRDVASEGEHPLVVVGDMAARPRSNARIIVVANEKGGVGKSTLAFHVAIALCDAGHSVAAIDLDARQQSLARALAFRDATARRLDVELPSPRYTVLNQSTGAMLCQEIARIGWKCDFVVIDVAGSDSPLARRAIAMADTLMTPVNASFVDLDLLGRFHPTTHEVIAPGFFARMVGELREERLRRGLAPMDWLVMPNRLRGGSSNNQARFEAALDNLAPIAGFRIGTGLAERVAYRELFLLGLTHLDLRHIPQLSHMRSPARAEIRGLLREMQVEPRLASAASPMAEADEMEHVELAETVAA